MCVVGCKVDGYSVNGSAGYGAGTSITNTTNSTNNSTVTTVNALHS